MSRAKTTKTTDVTPPSDPLFAALKEFFGYPRFLEGQEAVVRQILADRDLCVVMPTGAGKSLCYQLPTLMRPGYALVVSPLISLMKDQVDALVDRNLAASFINSTVPSEEQARRLHATVRGDVKLLYVAPERFRAKGFRRFLETCPPALLVVDEAHCISQWGHDFRPDYLRIGEVLAEFKIPQVCAFTATATPEVRRDICERLCRPQMTPFVTGFQRPNLSFAMVNCQTAAHKTDMLRHLLQTPAPTIIYSSTRKTVDLLAADFNGLLAYHAGMDQYARADMQNRFMNDPMPVLVATCAFGMGIDRPDVRRVIHFNMPGSLEAYYQEAGRAGRDGEAADCTFLFTWQDRFIQEFLIEVNNPGETFLRQLHAALRKACQESGSPRLELTHSELQGRIKDSPSEKHIGGALRVLEKYGILEREASRRQPGTLRFLGDLRILHGRHAMEATQRARLVNRCLQAFGPERSAAGVDCTLDYLADIAGLSQEQVQRVLHALHGTELEWTPPRYSGVQRLVAPDKAELELDFAALHHKHDLDLARLKGVLDYTQTKDCRQRFLVDYFGQKVGSWSCEVCDICRQSDHALLREPTAAERKTIRTILQTVLELGGRYGKGRVAQLLAGAAKAEVLKGFDDEHPRFGALRRLGVSQIMRFLTTLQKAGCIETVGHADYPRIDITTAGWDVVNGKTQIKLDFPPAAGK